MARDDGLPAVLSARRRMTDLRAAISAADRQGMTLTPSPDNPERCTVRCKACNWGHQFADDVVTRKYLRGPYGCLICRAAERDAEAEQREQHAQDRRRFAGAR